MNLYQEALGYPPCKMMETCIFMHCLLCQLHMGQFAQDGNFGHFTSLK